MSFLDQNLLPGEEIIYRTKKHYIIFFTPALLIIVACVFLFNSNHYVVKLAIFPAAAAVIAFLNQLLLYVTSEFAVTNKRVRMREGFFVRHTKETRLATIADVQVDQNVLGQLLNYGSVSLQAFGGSEDPFTLLDKPNEFQKQLQLQLDKITRT